MRERETEGKDLPQRQAEGQGSGRGQGKTGDIDDGKFALMKGWVLDTVKLKLNHKSCVTVYLIESI